MPQEQAATFITAFCRNCNEPRYRSIKPLRVGVDKSDPTLFQPVTADVPQLPVGEGKAVCPFCSGPWKFLVEMPGGPPPPPDSGDIRQQAMEAEQAAAQVRQAFNEYSQPLPVPTPSPVPAMVRQAMGDVQEVFRIEDGEEMVNVLDTDTKLLLVTNRRVVAVWK